MRRSLLAVVLALAATSFCGAADPPPPPADTDTDATRRELDAVRDELVALDIEKALSGLAALLERPGLTETARVEALDLRAQAHAAGDELDAVERDYRSILELKPGYVPNPQLISKKALDRFAKTRAAAIGTVRLDLDPNDASVTVDDRPVTLSAEGSFPAVAGERRLKLAHKGFDPIETTVRAVAGQNTAVKLRLVPNARALVVRTDVEGVAVALDGTDRGVTARPVGEGVAADAMPSLVLDDASIGEHQIVLTKSCFAMETLHEIVSVDLADRSPKLLPPVAMRPARTRISVTGATYDGELRVDGQRVAALPLDSFSVCPGARALEVASSGRVVWSGTLAAEESDLAIDLTPRPNAVLVGAGWPKSWAKAVSSWSVRAQLAAPAGADLTTPAGWAQVPLPPGVDLAVGVIPSPGAAGSDRTVIYSPSLHEVEERPLPPPASTPSWVAGAIGATPVDGEAGTVLLARIAPDGPSAKAGLLPGDRLIAIAGRAVTNAAAARDAEARLGAGIVVSLDVASPSQSPRKVECTAVASPRLAAPRDDGSSRAVRAAWASVAATSGPDATFALAVLAELLESAGQDASARDAWRRVRALASGALAARAAYALGVGLQAEGKPAAAIEAFGQARAGAAQFGDPVLGAASLDRLADLGVASR